MTSVFEIKRKILNEFETKDNKITHTFINGGKLYVPKEQ